LNKDLNNMDQKLPLNPAALELEPPQGGLASFPPADRWHDWTEYDAGQWPRRVERHYSLIPTICFNCEAACGLLAYVDKRRGASRSLRGTLPTQAAVAATAPKVRRLSIR